GIEESGIPQPFETAVVPREEDARARAPFADQRTGDGTQRARRGHGRQRHQGAGEEQAESSAGRRKAARLTFSPLSFFLCARRSARSRSPATGTGRFNAQYVFRFDPQASL